MASPEDAVQAVNLLVGTTGGFFPFSLLRSQGEWGWAWSRDHLQFWVRELTRKCLGLEHACSWAKDRENRETSLSGLGWKSGNLQVSLLTHTPNNSPGRRGRGIGRARDSIKKLLALVLHQMHILTDLLKGHLCDRAGQHWERPANIRSPGHRVARGTSEQAGRPW